MKGNIVKQDGDITIYDERTHFGYRVKVGDKFRFGWDCPSIAAAIAMAQSYQAS